MPCDSLSNDPDTLIQASIKRSISDSVVLGPRLTRTAAPASCGGTPMAASTCEDWTLPAEQAAPADTATPARSKAMTAGSALNPATATTTVLASRSKPRPQLPTPGHAPLS